MKISVSVYCALYQTHGIVIGSNTTSLKFDEVVSSLLLEEMR
jgi:hypothetical protein